MRPQDRLILNERHPEEAAALRQAVGRDARVKITGLDGYVALNAMVPPKERRGLVLVDPPFEEADEFARMADGFVRARRKWPTGVYALWYPIKDPAAADAFVADLAGRGIDRLLRLELTIDRGPRSGAHARGALIGCGMIVANPPFTLEDEARVLLAYLARRLAAGGKGSARVERISGGPAAAPASR